MSQNFLAIQKGYLEQAWSRPLEELEIVLPGQRQGDGFHFKAFGEACELYPDRIILGGQRLSGPEGILIALYASYTPNEPMQLHPLKSFKELPGSMPYQGAFATHAEQALQPYVLPIQEAPKGSPGSFFRPYQPGCSQRRFFFHSPSSSTDWSLLYLLSAGRGVSSGGHLPLFGQCSQLHAHCWLSGCGRIHSKEDH